MHDVLERLGRIAAELRRGEEPQQVTVRELLSWFGALRRGFWIVRSISHALRINDLVTKPDFEGAYIDEVLSFVQTPAATPKDEQRDATQPSPPDPTYRIGKLASANKKPVFVRPDDAVEKAVTLMLSNDFSQLPVMTSDRDVKGVISWTSLGSRLALGQKCDFARQCMDNHQEISSDTSLFAAIDAIVANQYVLIRNLQKEIVGIVTTSDLSLQFQQLGEPFLLIGEIENYIRRMLQDRFTKDELAAARDPADDERQIESVSDLTFGEYRRLLENPECWKKLGLSIDRTEFIHKLDEIRRIRNDVMHFDPDGIPESDLKVLRDFVSFLQRLASMKAI